MLNRMIVIPASAVTLAKATPLVAAIVVFVGGNISRSGIHAYGSGWRSDSFIRTVVRLRA